ncbi:10367_t:CDS:2 [Diversispora eburnea]|uniref:10367_t:CDS:1 n=1 Tax=Diversispora eburnea TaxID=1213867 RepID=A0A9N8W3J9_9GLOM|nr:10367_t:CDS:2 [Diversispora eburnea]
MAPQNYSLTKSVKLKQQVILGYPDTNYSGICVVSGVEESFIIDNDTSIEELPPITKQTYFVNSLVSLFCENKVSEVFIVASINFSEKDKFVYLGRFPKIDEMKIDNSKLKGLSPTLKLQDHFFNTLITLLKVEYIATKCFLYPGKYIRKRSSEENIYEIEILKNLVEVLDEFLDAKISMTKVLDTRENQLQKIEYLKENNENNSDIMIYM